MPTLAEYIWIDGTTPTSLLRSKTKVMQDPQEEFPEWIFDGSSTSQAPGGSSDRVLRPVCVVPDPIRSSGNHLVMCEVFYPDGRPHESNNRAELRSVLRKGAVHLDSWFGFEQEYTLFRGPSPLGFGTERRHPGPQGPYYCGVGADEVYGRSLVEEHLSACLHAGLNITGVNAEVLPGQWEFQVGGPESGPLTSSDHIWIARWLLYRIGENHGITATLDPKPVPGDWNGAGCHVNFSTRAMRAEGGMSFIEDMCEMLGKRCSEHLAVYGHGNEARLTGRHETCSFREFRWGVGDRTASIRIPTPVRIQSRGYLEDRRPAANADPYQVATAMLKSAMNMW